MVQLNQKQQYAVDMALRAAQTHGNVVVLSGPAGTGKTTTLRTICDVLPGSRILAPTGRAAVRAAELTGQQASTIHRWMYKPIIDKKTGAILHFEKRVADEVELPESNLLIVDEASMLTRAIWDDLRRLTVSARVSVLLVGDPCQLPPVTKEDEPPFSVFFSTFKFDDRVDLDEVFRQALDSPIIRAATEIRQTQDWSVVKNILSEFVVDADPSHVKMAAKHLVTSSNEGKDATVISYTNAVRHDVNRKVRLEYQIDPDADPLSGEPLLIRKTSYNTGVFNGQIIDFAGFQKDFVFKGHRFGIGVINGVKCTLSLPELLGGSSPPFEFIKVMRDPYVSANLGYSLTAHSAQGSEWDDVIIVFEKKILRVMSLEDRIRWVYTSFTRAKKNVFVYTLNN